MKDLLIHNDSGYQAGIAAANSMDGLPIDDFNNIVPGELYAANASRFVQAHFQEPLTQFAVDWTDDQGLDNAIEFIAPSVQSPHRFEYAEFPNAEAFVSDLGSDDDLRNIGANFKEVRYTSSKTQARTYNRGLTMRVDVEEIEGMPNWREHFTGKLMQRLKRNHLRRAWTMAIAAATNEAVTWDTSAGKDPDQDVLARRITYKNTSGLPPNRALYTDGAWNKRSIGHRAQSTAGGFGSAIFATPETASSYLRMQILVSSEVYQTSATAKTPIQGASTDYVILFRAEPGAGRNDPSNFKNFWTPCPMSGQRYAVYVQPFGVKFWDITVEHYSLLATTTTSGVRMLTVS